MRIIPVIIVLIFTAIPGLGQEKYWIYFAGEKKLDDSLDIKYLELLQSYDIQVENSSRWLNAVSSYLEEEQKDKLLQLTFVKEIESVNSIAYEGHSKTTELTDLNFTHALDQINASAFLEAGLSGRGIKIGILDGGFSGARKNPSLKAIFEEDRVAKTRDYIANQELLNSKNISTKDWHGTTVWKYIAGVTDEIHSGLASDAIFYLARTEHGDKEYRGEEDNWIAALEWMHTEGVKLINSSLGYSNGFNNPKENYKPSQMDGKSTAISRAAQIATEKKGMILIVSAGNDGNNSNWKVITAPADAKGVISVGATQKDQWIKAGYSAVGADFVNYLKPDLACYSASGTSFSAPVVTGMVACMLQIDSTLGPKEVKQLLQNSGHLYPYGNNYLGYGVPDCGRILNQLNENARINEVRLVKNRSGYFPVDRKPIKGDIILFHKKDKFHIVQQKVISTKKGRYIIHRPKDIRFTTVHYGMEVIEIQWK